jgi:soluble lytic murein transglycosylase-like protein
MSESLVPSMSEMQQKILTMVGLEEQDTDLLYIHARRLAKGLANNQTAKGTGAGFAGAMVVSAPLLLLNSGMEAIEKIREGLTSLYEKIRNSIMPEPTGDEQGKESIFSSILAFIRKIMGGGKKQEMPAPETKPIPSPTPSTPAPDVSVTRPSQQAMSYIDEASRVSGVDKALLLAIAHRESRFKTGSVSSAGATGMFQIMPKTWKGLIRKYPQFGFTDKDIRNPRANAIMGAIYVKEIISGLQRSLGHKPSVADIYAGYMLGPTGVRKLLRALEESPDGIAAKVFPSAARESGNRSIFFKKDGTPKTVAEVYATFYEVVGLPYLKFAQQENTTTEFAPSHSHGSRERKVSEASTPTIRPAGNTAAVESDYQLPPVSKPAEKVSAVRTEEAPSPMFAFAPMEQDYEYNFIRNKGRLLNIGVA